MAEEHSSATDYALLMSRNPADMNDADIDLIIERMRKARLTFNTGPAPAEQKLTKKEAEVKSAGLGLSLNLELKK